MTSIHHQNHAAIQHWFEDLARQAHIQTTPAPPISDVSERNPTKQLAADLMLIDVSLREPNKDGGNVALDFSMVTSAATTYCGKSATIPLHAAEHREKAKLQKYADAYKDKHNIHFIPVVFESGGAFGEKAQDVFSKICNLITQTSGQSGSAIAHFWKSRLLVTLAAITYRNVQHWANAHTKRYTPDSVETDMMDYYDHDERERKRMHHSSGPVRIYRAGGGSGGDGGRGSGGGSGGGGSREGSGGGGGEGSGGDGGRGSGGGSGVGGSGGDGGADGGHGGINEGADTTELDIIYYY
jgi:uncharacterized membrane protein YgcG